MSSGPVVDSVGGILLSGGNKLSPNTSAEVSILYEYGFPEAPTLKEIPQKLDLRNDLDYDDGEECVGPVPETFDRYVICRDCFRWRKIKPSCQQRNCPRCQRGRSNKLAFKYSHALANVKTGFGRRWIAITLTGYVVDKEHLGDHVRAFGKDARAFLKKRYLGGLITIEHTLKPEGYYIHAHGLVLGDFIKQDTLQNEWGRIVWVSAMERDPEGRSRSNRETVSAGLGYLLKYVTKGVALRNTELHLVKGLRYVSSFGEMYNMQVPTIESRCAFCNGRLALGGKDDIDAIEKDKLAHGSEALEIKRSISWVQKAKKPSEADVKEAATRLKEFVSSLWLDGGVLSGLSLALRWLLDRNDDPPLVVPAFYDSPKSVPHRQVLPYYLRDGFTGET